MKNREDVIIELLKKYDPRSARWEYRAIMDSLQDCEDTCTMKDLERVVKEKYDCDLFTYSSLYNQVQSLLYPDLIHNPAPTNV